MPWILVSGLAASVASFLVAAYTGKPAITVTTDNKNETESNLFKYGFYTLLGLACLQIVRKFAKK